jgi:hypothetical protein
MLCALTCSLLLFLFSRTNKNLLLCWPVSLLSKNLWVMMVVRSEGAVSKRKKKFFFVGFCGRCTFFEVHMIDLLLIVSWVLFVCPVC